jgi:hypothetical protein
VWAFSRVLVFLPETEVFIVLLSGLQLFSLLNEMICSSPASFEKKYRAEQFVATTGDWPSDVWKQKQITC